MRNPIALLIVATLTTACGEKKAPEPAAASADSITNADVPPEAKAFANRLLKTTISSFNPTGATEFTYTAMTFNSDGTWVTKATLRLGGESVDCEETGSWLIDSMNGDSALMEWKVTQTNCPARASGTEQRVSVLLDGDDVKISYR